jgi:very-short-patch-repair endonuclease
MVTSKTTLEKIREIISKNYAKLAISVLGKSVLTDKELKELKAQGIDISNTESLFALLYNHAFINPPEDTLGPKSVEDMESQQSVRGLLPEGSAHDYVIENLNDKTKQLIDKLKVDVISRVEGLIRENNDVYRVDALQNLDRTDLLDELTKESSLGKLKQKLRDTSKEANRDWLRVAVTEMSNAIGIATTDRIVVDNRSKNLEEVYVYRIAHKDGKTCFTEAEEVCMATGELCQLKDIKVGDLLQSGTRKKDRNIGSKSKVVRIETKLAEVLEYQFSDGTVIKCTSDHPILVKYKKFLGFIPVYMLETTKVKFTVPKYQELTTGERASIGRMPSWALQMAPNYTDFFYFWQDYGPELLADIRKSNSFKDLQEKWQFPKIGNCRNLGTLAALCGESFSKYTKISSANNNYNVEYLEHLATKCLAKLDLSAEDLTRDLGLHGYKFVIKKYNISFHILKFWVIQNLGSAFDKKIRKLGKIRAQRAGQTSIANTPGLREKLNNEARTRLIRNCKSTSKPQRVLFNTLKLTYPAIQLEVPILEAFRADILLNNIIIEFDGSGHWLFGKGSKARDEARDRLCTRYGYSVIRIKSPKDKQPPIESLTKILEIIKPGEYKEIHCDSF